MATMDELAANISKTMTQAQRDLSNQDQLLFGTSASVQITKQDGTRISVVPWSTLQDSYHYQGKSGIVGDLNTFDGDKAGVYYQPVNAGSILSYNYPIANAGSLQVLKNAANGAKSCTQMYFPYTEPTCYIRNGNFNTGATTGTWSGWREQIGTPVGGPALIDSGTTVVTTSGTGAQAGKATVPHRLGTTPATIVVCNGDTEAGGNQGKWIFGIVSKTATNFIIKVTDVTTGNGVNTGVRVNWIATA